MSGDIQTRKRKAKGKKKAHLEALQREEYEQERQALKAMSYEGDDYITDSKGKTAFNNSSKSSSSSGSSNGEGEGSGIVAKIFFLILLVSLSLVVGLILVELRAAIKEMPSAVPEAAEFLKEEEPLVPEESAPIDEIPVPEVPPPILQDDPAEEYEPIEATPPLEEYIKVVEEVVEQAEEEPVEPAPVEEAAPEEPAAEDDSFFEAQESVPAENIEVVEIVEEVPVEVVEIIEEVIEVPAEEVEEPVVEDDVPAEVVEEPVEVVEVVEEVIEVPIKEVEEPVVEADTPVEVEEKAVPVEEADEEAAVVEEEAEEVVEEVQEEPVLAEEVQEEPALAEEVQEEPALAEEVKEEPAPAEEVEEATPVESEEETAPEEEVQEEASPVEEVQEEAAPVEEVQEEAAPEEEVQEEAVPVEEVEEVKEEPQEVVEEPAVVEEVQELDAPVEVEEAKETLAAQEDDDEAEEEDGDEEADDNDDDDDDDEEEEEEAVERKVDDDEEEEDEDDDDDDDVEEGEEKDGSMESLTSAYIRVETLAEEIMGLDPENAMVNQLTPHIAGVLRAMESGHTEGLSETLDHIQVILEDVKRRIEEDGQEPVRSSQTPEPEEASEPVLGTEPELVVTDREPVSAPDALLTESVAVESEQPLAVNDPVAQPPSVAEPETQPQGLDEPEPELVESESGPVEVSSEVEVEASQSLEYDVVEEAEPVVEEEEVPTEPEPQGNVPAEEALPQAAPYVVKEREPLFTAEEAQGVSEEVLADIESQIIPEGEDPLTEKSEDSGIPAVSSEEEGAGVSPPSGGEGEDPVPVEEVIPDPIHIEPLQEPEVVQQEAKEATPPYEKADITSDVDNDIREELDAAEKEIPQNPGKALNSFGAILHRLPQSARALYGRACSLDRLAEVERSNSRLEQAIATYRSVIDMADEHPELVPLPLLRMAAEKCIERMRFRGFMGKAVRVQQRLLQRFPDDIILRNQMGVTFLLMNQPTAAKDVFKEVLEKWPEDGFAQVHYGFVLKTTYNNNTAGIEYMQKGISSGAEGTQDGRFYFHLGDALQREGKTEEAYKLYDAAVEKGLFLSRYQRSLYNVDRLRSQPVWAQEETTYQEFFRKLEQNWLIIRKEGLEALAQPPQDGFRPEAENLQDTGDWKQYEIFSRGRKITANCAKTPQTCALVESFKPAAGCKRGQVKFSVMYPGTHVHAHTGPTNCRLRAHLGLLIPEGLRLRVGDTNLSWAEGRVFVFDDSWEHEVWHEGDSPRLILIVDVWHPELTEEERTSLSAI
ncbi:titin-like isoform X2 [Penaeus japonicus]|uniref:titin-like isoform X2 n=1 Tax=Penaeus japonicus TaxID=27405 RepID=UPI001C712F7C|nr:titin-like isoform X2 [Penaeus japonicus]